MRTCFSKVASLEIYAKFVHFFSGKLVARLYGRSTGHAPVCLLGGFKPLKLRRESFCNDLAEVFGSITLAESERSRTEKPTI